MECDEVLCRVPKRRIPSLIPNHEQKRIESSSATDEIPYVDVKGPFEIKAYRLKQWAFYQGHITKRRSRRSFNTHTKPQRAADTTYKVTTTRRSKHRTKDSVSQSTPPDSHHEIYLSPSMIDLRSVSSRVR